MNAGQVDRHEAHERDGAPSRGLARVQSSERDDVRVVAVSGEVDASNVHVLREATLDLRNDALGIVLDLSEASFIDSATIGLLFELDNALPRRRQALRIVCPEGSPADRLLELTAFDPDTLAERECDAAITAIRQQLSLRE
jgi:anti-anti-sigma factor